MKPSLYPQNRCFSSGPCAKRPGWDVCALSNALVGRSHRSKDGRARIQRVLDRTRSLLGVPDDYRIGIVPASDSGAVEMAMWSLLGPRGVDALAWESFGNGWVTDITKQLKLPDVRVLTAPYGQLPDLAEVDWTRDVVFAWNGTTSGVCVPNADWIPDDREGLAICDATSAVFAMEVEFPKLDVVTYSWQKVLGGEAQHGVIVLSPKAVERLESYEPSWPMPKIFRMTKNGKLMEPVFQADTINTPSMLCIEDALDGLRWADEIGGLPELIRRSRENLTTVAAWVERTDWVDFLAEDPTTRSSTSICLKIVDPWFTSLPAEDRAKVAKEVTSLLEQEEAGFDIAPYREAPPGLRIWGGATILSSDLELLFPWLDWAYGEVKSQYLTQLREKQKVRRYYGVLEGQFRNYYETAARQQGMTGENLLCLLESRLDNVVYRLGFGASRREARQLIRHGRFTVNGRKANIPSYRVKTDDIVSAVLESEGLKAVVEDATDLTASVPAWLQADHDNMVGKVLRPPSRADIDIPIQESLIVELYSK